jgi:N-acetylgalactosamine-N,N'-diacetylbacillosaminyl-diphospho-undecaprenol 4-alpha-N-acetylgalactosaminyltransferase
MDSGKNHIVLIRAFAAMLAADPQKEAELWLIGQGPLKEQLEQETKQLGISAFVRFLGYRKDVEQILQQSDVFVFSSQREGFPNVLLEAMAVGLPVISTDCEYGPREIITSKNVLPDKDLDRVEVGKYGILLPCNKVAYLTEAMSMLYRNDELKKDLTHDYAQLLNGYKIETIARQYEKMIAEM